ncbi:hypothetical protein DM45_3837 [Burkholderia mallei]|nr:hypothetical protein DM45_3837 [Burkholderia mallei]KOT22743.1 hypothetical protein DM52_2537 [Burkholderia mallei]
MHGQFAARRLFARANGNRSSACYRRPLRLGGWGMRIGCWARLDFRWAVRRALKAQCMPRGHNKLARDSKVRTRCVGRPACAAGSAFDAGGGAMTRTRAASRVALQGRVG